MAFLLPKPLALIVPSSVLGLVTHLGYFIRGEHHTESWTLVLITVLIPSLVFAGQMLYMDLIASEAARNTGTMFFSFYGAFYTSMITYRVFFHRLNKFPGPFMAKVSKFHHVYLVIPKSDNYKVLDQMYHKYGPFVRTGHPSEITIFDPAGPVALLGPNSKCTKASWYDAGLPLISLHTARDRGAHDRRRRVWERGFSMKSLQDYENRVIKYAHSLIRKLSENGSKPVNATDWLAYYSFDVMGDLTFGKSFDLLESGKQHHAIKMMQDGQSFLGIVSPIQWSFPILKRIPGAVTEYLRWVEWSEQRIKDRMEMDIKVLDIMSWLLEASKVAEDKQGDWNWLSGDSRLLIVAGSDTTASTLVHVCYELAKDPSQMTKLRAELKPLVKSTSDFNVNSVRDAPQLNGVINEPLRLYPPTPSGVYRLTLPEGIMVGETFIPGDTTVITPNYTLGRLKSIYPYPNSFIPERWSSRPSLLPTKEAFVPFSLGPYGCIGKTLAYMEMRTVIALLVLNFDIRFAPGEDGEDLVTKTRDSFTLKLGGLWLVFERLRIEGEGGDGDGDEGV